MISEPVTPRVPDVLQEAVWAPAVVVALDGAVLAVDELWELEEQPTSRATTAAVIIAETAFRFERSFKFLFSGG